MVLFVQFALNLFRALHCSEGVSKLDGKKTEIDTVQGVV